ncbi:hypothetical protein AAHB33_06825 [Paenarthrobacter sp. S56]|uniref:hypothetical protein n=1 Tax=Paenarthrobacter sp. S56 TaxID=3138179 RepID=UPI00321A3EF5
MQPTVLHTVMPSNLRRRIPAVVAGVLLAAGAWLAPQGVANAAPCTPGAASCPSLAAPTEPTPTQAVLVPDSANTKPQPRPEPTRYRDTPPPAAPAPAPAAPAPAVQAPQPAVVQAPPVAPEVAEPASEAPAAPTPTATAATSPSATPSPSKSSNWNTPIDKGKQTQAAALAPSNYSGPNLLGLFGILGGVLLVGLGGLGFALWSKNRLSSH